ncbi:MAG: hypothetical protein RI959_1968 [Pseudomonadota bacterium]|jgi:hypothetical protein
MRKLIVILGYMSLLGPPHAIRIHSEAQGGGGELDGLPLWIVAAVELMVRAGMLLVISWGLQEALSHETFRRFQVFFLLMAVFASGVVHTLVHYYCFGLKWGKWAHARLRRTYRLGRNLAYSVVPAFPVAGAVLVWQELNQIALFQGQVVESVFFGTWLMMALLGVTEALVAKRMPHGIVHVNSAANHSKKPAP